MVIQTQLKFTSVFAKGLLDELLKANTEEQVHSCLEREGLLDDSYWLNYGGVSNNVGQFSSQQETAEGALVEKIINGIDAVLMAKAHENGDIQNNPPSSMFQAVERYFGIPEGKLVNVNKDERWKIARSTVQVAFSGKKSPDRPTITVVDQGEGQDPDAFPNTFLSLSADNKMRTPFVQGKFNMGSTGAVPFCGKKHQYQLILSRRHPKAPGDGSLWGFTVVRRRDPVDEERLPVYQYLAPSGKILTLQENSLPIWSNSDGSYKLMSFGSLVRLYEYDLRLKTNAKLDFSRMLSRRLFRTPIPIHVVERRFKANSLDDIVIGLDARLFGDAAKAVEQDFPVRDMLNVPNLGKVNVFLVPFKEGTQTQRWMNSTESVIFTVNGQAHAFESRDYLRRKGNNGARLNHLAPSLLIEVDCSQLPKSIIWDLFMGSRDRMRDNDQKRTLLRELSRHLGRHEGLRKLNGQRRMYAIQKSTESGVQTQKLFQEMVESTPALLTMLNGGGVLPDPGKIVEENGTPFSGRRFPTFLKWEKGGPFLEKHCPANSYCVLELQTDVENSFFDRPIDPGECTIEPQEWVMNRSLYNGKLYVRMAPPKETLVGVSSELKVKFRSPALLEDLVAEGRLHVGPPHKKCSKPTLPKPPKPPKPPKHGSVHLPEIREVQRDSWEKHGFDKRSVASVDQEEGKTIVFVNMDNQGLYSYCYPQPERAPEIREMYKVAAAALALSVEGLLDNEDVNTVAARKVISAVGDVLAPAVDFAGRVSKVE